MNKYFILIIIVLAAVTRLIPHPPNPKSVALVPAAQPFVDDHLDCVFMCPSSPFEITRRARRYCVGVAAKPHPGEFSEHLGAGLHAET